MRENQEEETRENKKSWKNQEKKEWVNRKSVTVLQGKGLFGRFKRKEDGKICQKKILK